MGQAEPGSAAFYLGKGAKIDSVKIEGNVAGRDVNIGLSPANAAAVSERAHLLEVLNKLLAEVEGLEEAPSGLRSDAADELKKAASAGVDGDDGRLVEKLETARGYLERIAAAVPAAVTLAQTVATLVSRVPGLS
jgi:hypothetical protein